MSSEPEPAIHPGIMIEDINCDLGEGESPARTRALMRWITSANVACGGHAGDEKSMRHCAALSQKHGVKLGAHPGLYDRASMGRREIPVSARLLRSLLMEQIGRLQQAATLENTTLHHVKLHGALYHAVEKSNSLAEAYLRCMRTQWPGLRVYAFAGGKVCALAQKRGVEVWPEAFIDRGYGDDGQLISRSKKGALIEGKKAIAARLEDLHLRSHVRSQTGQPLTIEARTLCVHGDSPKAIQIATQTRKFLDLP